MLKCPLCNTAKGYINNGNNSICLGCFDKDLAKLRGRSHESRPDRLTTRHNTHSGSASSGLFTPTPPYSSRERQGNNGSENRGGDRGSRNSNGQHNRPPPPELDIIQKAFDQAVEAPRRDSPYGINAERLPSYVPPVPPPSATHDFGNVTPYSGTHSSRRQHVQPQLLPPPQHSSPTRSSGSADRHSRSEQAGPSEIQNSNKKNNRIPCKWSGCTQNFSSTSNRNVHFRAIHKGEKSYLCREKDCSKAFKYASSLAAHVKTHSKIFLCQICGLCFSTEHKLTRHREEVRH